jgi:dihydrofolate reductase
MRKLIMFNLITLDGFFEGLNREIDWHSVDEEFNDYSIQQLNQVDTILFGRVTYQMMASYWPTKEAIRDDPIVAGLMNNSPKIVFSNIMQSADWQNTSLIRGDAVEAILKLKQLPGKDLVIFGSGKLTSSLASIGLIDEYRLIVNPIILGGGNPLFRELKGRLHLKLINSKVFKNGNVLLCYQPV